MKRRPGRPATAPQTDPAEKAEALRRRLGLTVAEFATALGLSSTSYWRFRRGIQTPSMMDLRIANVSARYKRKKR